MVLEVGDAKDGIPGAMPACGQVGTSSETPDSMNVAGKQTENEDRVARGSLTVGGYRMLEIPVICRDCARNLTVFDFCCQEHTLLINKHGT